MRFAEITGYAATWLLVASNGAAAAGNSNGDYDTHLCQTAQRLIINAPDDFPVIEQRGTSNGFHTIQMSVDESQGAAVIAMTTHYAEYDGIEEPTYIACKMVNRQRVADTLAMNLPGPDRACADVNRATLTRVLNDLPVESRQRYAAEGRPLQFGDDAIIPTGGEWLPVTLDPYISATKEAVVVRAPSVRVPWNSAERNFYQGTQHCKLISYAAMRRWVTQGAFEPDATLIPASDTACTAPRSMSSEVGSCLFYFAPADSLFCQDYSGAAWDTDSARAECAKRHASKAALSQAANRYEGAGGLFSEQACAQRSDAPDIKGTCVFHCRAGDETLWHVSGALDPRMTRGCDLFVE